MNFFNLNNNVQPDRLSSYQDKMKVDNRMPMAFLKPQKMSMESGYQYNMKVDTPVPTTVFRNCKTLEIPEDYNYEDEYSIVENFEDNNIEDVVKGILNEDDKEYLKGIENHSDRDAMRGITIKDNQNYMKGVTSEHEKDHTKDKPLCDVHIVLNKLPDSVVQQYLAKKTKTCETMIPKQSLSKPSILRSVRKENHKADGHEAIPALKQYLSKKQNVSTEADEFVKRLSNPIMQQHLANTEMGCLTEHFIEPIPESKVCPVESNNCTTDSLIENIFGTDEIQCPVKIERNDLINNYQQQYSAEMDKSFQADNFMKGLSYPAVHQHNVDLSSLNVQQQYGHVEKIGDFVYNPANTVGQENFVKKQTIRKMKRISNTKQSRKSGTFNLAKRICPNCQTYVQNSEIHKAASKVKCSNCKANTRFECNKCKKQVESYNGMVHHLSYSCDARMVKKCAHCQYSAKRKHPLAIHIKRKHAKLMSNNFIAQRKCKNGEKSRNESSQGLMSDRRYENLIVLKKQKEVACNSEWYIEKVKRSDPKADKSIDSSITSVLEKPNSTPPVPNPTSVKDMSQLFCEYCETKIAVDGPCTQSEIICRVCGSTLLFKCSKCQSTCESYLEMRSHLKKDCTSKEIKKSIEREKFYCKECNYRSYFQGLVMNHENKVHSIHKQQEFLFDSSIRNASEDDLDLYFSEHEIEEL